MVFLLLDWSRGGQRDKYVRANWVIAKGSPLWLM
jgi:hypothetical protein